MEADFAICDRSAVLAAEAGVQKGAEVVRQADAHLVVLEAGLHRVEAGQRDGDVDLLREGLVAFGGDDAVHDGAVRAHVQDRRLAVRIDEGDAARAGEHGLRVREVARVRRAGDVRGGEALRRPGEHRLKRHRAIAPGRDDGAEIERDAARGDVAATRLGERFVFGDVAVVEGVGVRCAKRREKENGRGDAAAQHVTGAVHWRPPFCVDGGEIW